MKKILLAGFMSTLLLVSVLVQAQERAPNQLNINLISSAPADMPIDRGAIVRIIAKVPAGGEYVVNYDQTKAKLLRKAVMTLLSPRGKPAFGGNDVEHEFQILGSGSIVVNTTFADGTSEEATYSFTVR